MVPRPKPSGWLFAVLLLALAACTPGEPVTVVDTPAPVDPALVGEIAATFAAYRVGVMQGDGDAAVEALDEASLESMAAIAELAATASEQQVRTLPAAEQLLVLTYRLRPALLTAADPYRELVDSGLAGQDRSLGDLGDVTPVGVDLALGEVTDPGNGTVTPLRWRFVREGDRWRFDLVEAHRLLSQAIANGANRAGVEVDDLVAATVVDLSGEDETTVESLYTEIPG